MLPKLINMSKGSDFSSRIGSKVAVNQSSFAEKMEAKSALVYDLRVTISGKKKVFIVKIRPTSHKAFLRAVAEDKGFNLRDFGEVLYHGEGEPPETLKQELRKKYGMYS